MSLTEIVNNEQGCFEVRGTNDDIKKFLILLDEQETQSQNKDNIDNNENSNKKKHGKQEY